MLSYVNGRAPTRTTSTAPVTQIDPLQGVAHLRSTASYRRGQEIYGAGESAEFWYHLLSGAARKCALLADGRRRIVDFLLPGDFFGFRARHQRNFAVEAIIPGTIVATYPRRRIEVAADTDPALGRWVRETAFESISRSQGRVLITGRVTALEKVGSFLVEMGCRSFDRIEQTVVLPMSRYDIADYLGLSVETVSRALTGFKQRGAIRFVGPHRVRLIDRRALENDQH
jgi:CRP/FNR family transcriptional regulator, nitrogen fixation regulation protein